MAIDWNKARGSSETKKKKSKIDWEKAGAYSSEELRSSSRSNTKQSTQQRKSLDIDAREWASIRAEAQKSNALKTTDKIASDYARNNPPRSATTSSEEAKEAFKSKTVDMQRDTQSSAEQKRLENMSESERADYVRENAQKPSGTKASKITLENKKKPQVEQMVGEEVETEMQKPAKSEQAYKNEYEKSEKQYQDYIEANGGRGKMILDTLGDVAKDEYEVDKKIIELDRNRKEAEANYEYAQEYARYVEQKRYKDMYDSLDESDYALLDDIINSQEASDNANLSFVLQSVRDQEGTTRDDTTMYTEASTKAYEALKAKGYTEDEITKLMRYRLSLRNAEISKQHTEQSKQFAKEHPLLASGVSVMTNLASPVAIVEPIRAYMTDTPVDPNSSWFGASQMTSDIRQTVQDENDLYVELNGKQVDIHDEIYNATMSTADSLLAGTIMPGLGLESKSTSGIVRAMVRTADSMLGGSLVGGQAMASAMQDVARRGGTPEEVIKTGLFHFFSETVSEAVSLGNFKALQSSGKKGLVNLGVDLLKNAGVNASEEMVTEAANIVYDKYALGDISNFELNVQAYMKTQKPDGTYYSREEAEKLAWKDAQKQIREAGQSGFIQGLISGAPATVSGRFKQNVSNASLGQQLKQSGQAEAIVKEARQSDDKAVQEWVQRINKTDKTTSQLNVKDSDLGGVAVAMADKNEDGSPNLSRYFPEVEKSAELTAEEKAEISKPTLEKEGGKVISVTSVENVSDGKVEVKDSKGETRELDVNKLDGVAKELWSYASKHFTEAKTVESFIDSYDGENVETYSRVYKGVFDLASTGMTANRIKEERFYDLDALNNTAFESAVKAGHTAMSLKAGMVDLTTVRKSKSQKLIMRVADAFGKRHGLNIVFINSMSKSEGFYTESKNQIVIAMDASGGAIARTLGHETFHYVKANNHVQAQAMSKFVMDTMTRLKGAEWVEQQINNYASEVYNTREKCEDEFVADQMFEVFANERAVKEFVAKDRNFAQKVLDHIRSVISEIKAIYDKLVSTGHYDDIAAWREDMDALQKLNDMMLDALRNIEQKRKTEQKTEKNTSDEVVNATKRVYDYSKSFSQQVDDYLNGLIPKSDTLVIGGTPKIYQDIGFNALPMTINTTHIDYALYGTKDSDHFLGKKALKQLPQKIESPIAVFVSNTKGTTSVIALLDFSVNGKQTIVPIVIDGFGKNNNVVIDSNALTSVYGKKTALDQLYNAIKQEASGMFSLLYVNKKEASVLLHRTGHQLSGTMIPRDGFYHSIRENNSPVKPKLNNVTESVQFKKWFGDWQNHPKTASKIVNADGTPKIMYHGTPNQFTEFDKKKAKSSGYYGRGFYFTDSKSHSSHYGNAMAVYLDVKNPLEQGKNHISKKQLRNFLEAVAENEDDYDIWNYGTEDIDEIINNIYKDDAFAVIQDVNATAIGDLSEAIDLFNKVNKTNYDGVITPTETVVYKPTQIKSATDNIGTFDKDNPDIRFSTTRTVEETKDLVAVHNMQESELLKTLQLGGFPMPSIAIIKAKQGHSEYGPVSVVFNKSTIDPKASKNNKVYGGDAWTPTYPTIEYKVNDKVQEKISNLHYELYRKYGADEARPLYNYAYDMERQLNSNRGEAGMIESLKDDERLMQLYLLQSGKGKVEPVKKQTVTELSEADVEMYDYLISAVGKDVISELKTPPGKKPLQYRTEFYEKNGEKIENAYKQMLRDNFGFTDEQIDNVMNNMRKGDFVNLIRQTYQYMVSGKTTTKEETDSKATSEAIRNAIKDSGFNQWVDDLFKGVEEKSGIRNNADYFTASGNRRSWEALHWENTLENVVKVMKSQNNGVAAFFSGHAIWAVSAKDYKSIDELKADSDRLKSLPKEEYDAIKEGFGMRLNEIATSIMDKSESNQFIAADNAMQCIVEAVRNSKTKSGILNELRQYRQLDVTETAVDDIVSLVLDISNMPTEYFEAKPQRAVGLDEIAYVVVPNTSTELINTLNEQGIETRTYTVGDEVDRVRALNSDESVLFSTKREYSVSEDASDYILDSKEYQEIIDIVDQRYNLTNKKMLSPKAIDRLAGRLLSKASSKYDREQLTTRLTALFDYMANSSELDWEDVMRSAAEISYDILKNSSSIDRSMQNQYRDTLDYLKGLTIYISPEVKAEIKSRYGGLDNYRRVLGNRVKLTTTDSSKMSLDSLWKELNEYHPEMFGEEVGYLDQPEELATFFDIVKPKPVNQYELEWDIDEASYDFALQIYDEYFNIPEVQSQSRRHQLEMERLKGKYNAQIADIRRGYRERMKAIRDDRDAKINALRKENREAYEKLRTTKNAKIEETKELYRQRNKDYRDKRNEMDNRRKLRRQVLNTTKKLTDLLVNPSDKKHIPQELIVGIGSFAKAMSDHGAFSAQRAANLQRAFRNISENATDPDFNIASMYDDEIATMLENLVTELADKRIGEMTSSELRAINEIAQYFSHVVTMSNRAFSESIRERLSDLQTEAYDEISAQSKDKKRMVSKLNMGLLKPVTFFEVVESKTLEKLYTNIRNGEQKWAKIVSEAKQKNRSAQKEFGYKAWADDKVEVTTERGDKLSLTVKEALSIYATSRREQGVDHIMVGGIVLEEDARKQLEKKNKLRKNKDASVNVRSMNVPLTMDDIQTINSKLTKNQKAYADEMVAYMSNDMANLGNEVSMRLYGIRKYNEAHYFPLKSASNFLYTEPGVESDTRIKHMSMTKRTVPKANNPVMIDDFSKTVMSHCQDMALYSSFALPLEDFKRVWNYKTPSIDQKAPSSIKQQLDMIYGSNANRYIKQLLTDINGGVTKQAGADYVNKMIGLAKKSSVFASLSVAVQQPSALARSMAYIDPKYFVGIQKKGTWEEIKKYAPVAIVKEMGYFDTGIGRQAVEWMNETDYEGLKEKAFAFFRDSDYRDDKLSFLPAFMDEITWGRIWVAVKNETKAKYPELDVKSEEFLEKCGERFTYVIDRTQVYDSVFSRSEWMRSKDTGVKVATAFMSEPLTSYNMLYNAAVKLRHGDVKFATKTVAAYITSVVLNSALKSFVLAARDDDEEKSYWEKYLANLVSGITGEPFDMIPYFKDLISLIQGYDSSRMDTQVIADLAQASQTLLNANKTPWEKVRSVLNATGMVTGLPIKNIIRDTEMIVKGAEKIISGEYESTTNEGIKNAILESYDSTKYSILDVPKLAEQVVEAQINGDTEHYNKQKKNMLEKYNGDTKEVKKQLNRTLGEMYKEGKIDRTQATRFMRNTLTMKQKDIDKKFKDWEEQKKAKEDE